MKIRMFSYIKTILKMVDKEFYTVYVVERPVKVLIFQTNFAELSSL